MSADPRRAVFVRVPRALRRTLRRIAKSQGQSLNAFLSSHLERLAECYELSNHGPAYTIGDAYDFESAPDQTAVARQREFGF